jgi:penicillin-binding protein 2
MEANAYGRPLNELDFRQGKPGRRIWCCRSTRKLQMVAEQAMGDLQRRRRRDRSSEPARVHGAGVQHAGLQRRHLFGEGIDGKTAIRRCSKIPNRPLYNRALQGTYPPGSTIKPFMALAGLEYDVIDAQSPRVCNGQMSLPGSLAQVPLLEAPRPRLAGHGRRRRALLRHLFLQHRDQSRHRSHQGFLDQFGLGRATDVDLPLEKAGLLPSREWKRRVRKESWYPGETLNVGIGQGYFLTVTPIQLAQITARMAMRGEAAIGRTWCGRPSRPDFAGHRGDRAGAFTCRSTKSPQGRLGRPW